MNVRAFLTATVLVLLAAGKAAAQQPRLTLHIDKGLVTLDASGVTVDEILARWSTVTGLNVVSKNGHGSDVPVTLRLESVPERTALAMVLRDISGYIMGERRDPQSGVITVDRLMILPDSAAQAPTMPIAPAPRRPAFAIQAPQEPVESIVPPEADTAADAPEASTDGSPAPAFISPQLTQPGAMSQVAPFGNPTMAPPGVVSSESDTSLINMPSGSPTRVAQPQPAPPAPAKPATPFGPTGAPLPGTIAPTAPPAPPPEPDPSRSPTFTAPPELPQ